MSDLDGLHNLSALEPERGGPVDRHPYGYGEPTDAALLALEAAGYDFGNPGAAAALCAALADQAGCSAEVSGQVRGLVFVNGLWEPEDEEDEDDSEAEDCCG